jgi:hypothetical protein
MFVVEPGSVSLEAAMVSSLTRPWIMRGDFVMRLRLSMPTSGFPQGLKASSGPYLTARRAPGAEQLPDSAYNPAHRARCE